MATVKNLTKKLLKEVFVLHLATSDDRGIPSNCALEFVEHKGTLYWRSNLNSQHSKNLTVRKNSYVCITRTNQDGSGEGIQASGTSRKLKEPKEILTIRKLLDKKIIKNRSEAVSQEEDDRTYWAFSPKEMFYMNENIFGYGKVPITQNK